MHGRQEIESVLAQYGLGAIVSFRPTDGGYVNETWVVETRCGHYVVRRRHPCLADPRLVLAQHALMLHLGRAGFPVPAVCGDKYGATFVVSQDCLYEVHQYLDGVLCDPGRPEHLAAAARTLGWYHRVVEEFYHPVLHRAVERYGPSVLTRVVRGLIHEWADQASARVQRWMRSLCDQVADLAACLCEVGSLPELVIHGDYYAENLIMHNDQVVGVVDYDEAHWCSRAMEVAEVLIYFAKETKVHLEHIVYSGALDLDAVESFLAAYGTVVALSDAEIRALPNLIGTIWLCASLNPPMRPRPDAQVAPLVLLEVLYLADWSQSHADELVEIGFATRKPG